MKYLQLYYVYCNAINKYDERITYHEITRVEKKYIEITYQPQTRVDT